jgi:predicted RNA binding protein YcfA (HicA-like mRNA interferase family)
MKLPVVSGKKIVQILLREGYVTHSRKGSHVTLKKTTQPYTRVTVPLHDALKKGTLLNILDRVEITKKELLEKMK